MAPGIRTGIGVINRGAGQIQVTYKHQPLYTFIEDQQAGQTNGQGFKDFGAVWTVSAVNASSSPGSSMSQVSLGDVEHTHAAARRWRAGGV